MKGVHNGELTLSELLQLPVVNQGHHGLVVKLCTGYVAKIIPFRSSLIGDITSPFYAVNAEASIMRLLGEFYHTAKFVRSYVIKGAPAQLFDADQTLASLSRVIIMEEYPEKCLATFFEETHVHCNVDDFFKSIVFQVVFTLQQIYEVYPTFRHNDLGINNVLVKRCIGTKPIWYEWKTNGLLFETPNVGLLVYIADFDVASVAGVIDNYNTIELNMIFRSLTLGYRKDHKSDAFKFIYSVYDVVKDSISIELRMLLKKLFNGHLERNYTLNRSYATRSILKELPTTVEILECPDLFKKYQDTSVVRAKSKSHEYDRSMGEKRHVPIITTLGPLYEMPSRKYFELLETDTNLIKSSQRIEKLEPSRVSSMIDRLAQKNGTSSVSFIRNVFNRLDLFLSHNIVPENVVDVFIVLAFVDVDQTKGNVKINKEYPIIDELIELADLDVTPEQFIQLALQWSWWNVN